MKTKYLIPFMFWVGLVSVQAQIRYFPTAFTHLMMTNQNSAEFLAYVGAVASSGGSITNGTFVGGTFSLTTNTDLTASRVLVSDSAQRVTNSAISTTTLGYLDATSSIQTQLNAKGAATNGTFSGGTFTGATNVGLTVFGSASITNPATSRLMVYSNFTALGSLRVGPSSDGWTGNGSGFSGDAIIQNQLFVGGANANSGYMAVFNYEAGSALSPRIEIDNRTGTNSNMYVEWRVAGSRKGFIGHNGASSANSRTMVFAEDAGDGMDLQLLGNNASGQGFRFYTAEGGGRYLMKLHPTLGGLAIGSSYYSTAPKTNGLNVEGSVGFGTTNPQYPLDLNGQARIIGTNGINFGGTSGAADKTVTIHQSSANILALTATTVTVSGGLTIAGTTILTQSSPPASAAAAGTVGTIAWDADYIYVCTAANTWKRVAIATW
jgi:hypothetical protein